MGAKVWVMLSLRHLLLGAPVVERASSSGSSQSVSEELDAHLRAMMELLPRVYGDTDACKQAIFEIQTIVSMDSLLCKRAIFLYGLGTEQEMCDYWASRETDGSAALALDLKRRVLPFIIPRYVKHNCQRPDAFVSAAVLLSEMWPNEKLGNWPTCTP